MITPPQFEELGLIQIPPKYLPQLSGTLRVKLNDLLHYDVSWRVSDILPSGMNIVHLSYRTMYSGELNYSAKKQLIIEFEKSFYEEYL